MDIQTILNAIQPAFIIIVIAAAMSAAGYFYQWGVQKLPANAQRILDGLAKTVVQAIEQKYADNNTGSTLKKQQAMNMLADMSEELGIAFNTNNASAAIEAAVYALNLWQKYKAPPALADPNTKQISAITTTPAPASGADAAK
jgi:hypothetical protein